jgi:antitoxin (DNA-binding transcriptional repressor) of toxin-antitoxin stability system
MKTLNIHEAKTNLSAVLADIENTGKKYLICRNNKPIAELVPHRKKSRLKRDAFLSQVKIECDLTEPLTEEDWDV